MLQSKNDVLSLLSTIDQTENQIVTIAMMRDRDLIIQGLNILGLRVFKLKEEQTNYIEEDIIRIRSNFSMRDVCYYINQNPYDVSKTIAIALSGEKMIPMYTDLNSKITAKISYSHPISSI